MKSKWINATKTAFIFWMAIMPLFAVLLDLFCSTLMPDPQYGEKVKNFDYSIINQFIYYSVWNAMLTSIWGIFMIVKKYTKYSSFIVSDSFTYFIGAINIVVFLLYTGTFIVDKDSVVGFNTWYKILKYVIEHFTTPPLLVIYLIFMYKPNKRVSFKRYSYTGAFVSIIVPLAYLVILVVREHMLMDGVLLPHERFTPFPYDMLDPYKVSMTFFVFSVIGILLAHYVFSSLLNLANNSKWLNSLEIKKADNYKQGKINSTLK